VIPGPDPNTCTLQLCRPDLNQQLTVWSGGLLQIFATAAFVQMIARLDEFFIVS